jgi:quinol monooxygenase YgiN
MYVVAARWTIKEGKVEEVLSLIREFVPITRAEPGNRAYIVNQSVDNPRQIMLYEQYIDEAAFQFHINRPEFADVVKGRIWPLLESRSRELFRTVAPEPNRD